MSTTASEIRGRMARTYSLDEWFTGGMRNMFGTYNSPSHYQMVKLGRKEYGFRPYNRQLGGVAISYKCSYPEAQRRFKLMLLTRRMLR